MKKVSIITAVYALLILVGGIMGYVKAASLASLFSGGTAGILLLGCSYFIRKNSLLAYDIALGVSCCLLVFFCYRFVLTTKFAPAGILVILTALQLIYLGRKRPLKSESF